MAISITTVKGEGFLPKGSEWAEELIRKTLPGEHTLVARQTIYSGAVKTLVAASPKGLVLGCLDESQALKLTLTAWKQVAALEASEKSLLVKLKTGATYELIAGEADAAGLLDFYCQLGELSLEA